MIIFFKGGIMNSAYSFSSVFCGNDVTTQYTPKVLGVEYDQYPLVTEVIKTMISVDVGSFIVLLTDLLQKTFWLCNHFNAKKFPTPPDIDIQIQHGILRGDREILFESIFNDFYKCRRFMNQTIENVIVMVARACGVQLKRLNGLPMSCANKRQVALALKTDWEVKERCAFVHFLMNYIKDYLYKEVMGISFQNACENAFLEIHNIEFTNKHLLIKGGKTCVNSMYNECFNRIKHHFIRACLPKNVQVGVERKDVTKPPGWRRDKHIFFVHETIDKKTDTFEVTIEFSLYGFSPLCFDLMSLIICFQMDLRRVKKFWYWKSQTSTLLMGMIDNEESYFNPVSMGVVGPTISNKRKMAANVDDYFGKADSDSVISGTSEISMENTLPTPNNDFINGPDLDAMVIAKPVNMSHVAETVNDQASDLCSEILPAVANAVTMKSRMLPDGHEFQLATQLNHHIAKSKTNKSQQLLECNLDDIQVAEPEDWMKSSPLKYSTNSIGNKKAEDDVQKISNNKTKKKKTVKKIQMQRKRNPMNRQNLQR